MPREGTLRYENGWWRSMRESLVEWRPIGWLRGRSCVGCHEPVRSLAPDTCRHPGWSPAAYGQWSTPRRRLTSRYPASPQLWRGVMDVVFPHGAGLDGHQKTVMACRVTPDPMGQQADGIMEVRAFGPLTRALLAWSDGLTEAGTPRSPWRVPARLGNRSIPCWKAPVPCAWATPRMSSTCQGGRRTGPRRAGWPT
jgi:hypothetical protein